ncbi:hypothetical protein M9H77_00152 [Catharanthus roseus]|nr:hypothetical protein M9H77_00125 [Catharanthus roseus]KAI5640991.1 hypothetical protein M9H77_00152 [Catharanthus roseus]
MAKLLTPLCIPTKVSQRCTSPMDPAASLILFFAFLLRTFWYVLPPYYGSDPPDDKLNSALLLSRRTYPPRDSVLSLPTSRHHLAGSCRYQQRERNNQMETATNYGSWPRQRPRLSRSRGRSAPCPQIWVIFSLFILLQSDLAGERSQFATENKTASERTFVRFFSTKHGSLRITNEMHRGPSFCCGMLLRFTDSKGASGPT